MGDPTRFREFARFVAERWPDRGLRIADVAGGKGYLNAELWRLGYRRVVTFDKRNDRWTTRSHYRWEHFDTAVEPGFELVLGMHPDGATDQAIAYAGIHRCPFAVVPCCVVPNAYRYDGPREQSAWIDHLIAVAEAEDLAVERSTLSISGANVLLVGEPS